MKIIQKIKLSLDGAIAAERGEGRLVRVKRTLDNYFLCFTKLLKTAKKRHSLGDHFKSMTHNL